jgi:integrase
MEHYPPGNLSQQTLEQALARLLEHTADRVRDGIRSPHTLRMQAVHAQWLAALELPAELAGRVGGAQRLGDVRLEALTSPVLLALVDHMHQRGGVSGRRLSLGTTAKRKCTIGRALRLAVQRGELAVMPQMPEIGQPPARARGPRVLRNYAELLQVLAALPLRRAEWVQHAVWSCQRPGDVERNTWADVTLRPPPPLQPSMLIRSTKTRRPDGLRVKVPGPLLQMLTTREARLQSAGHPPRPGDPLVEPWPNVSRVLPLVCVRLGLPPLSAMGLRHTGFSWMVRRIGLTRAAQEWGGWSDFMCLQKFYAHALPPGLDQAADELASIVDEHEPSSPRNRGDA